ncbi:MAG: hypothetical protein WCD39_04380 [Methyloceanibacter sp.]
MPLLSAASVGGLFWLVLEGLAPDAGHPGGAWNFTISAALGNQHREDKKHDYEKT